MFFTQSLLRKKLTPAAMVITLALGMGLPLSASAEDTPQQPADQAPSGRPQHPLPPKTVKFFRISRKLSIKTTSKKPSSFSRPSPKRKTARPATCWDA